MQATTTKATAIVRVDSRQHRSAEEVGIDVATDGRFPEVVAMLVSLLLLLLLFNLKVLETKLLNPTGKDFTGNIFLVRSNQFFVLL